ncbi:outer membrane beta-barrel protein [Chitinophaga caseinilytica]|uniref:Outer membrane beta-barrel protein n=1 Tax=Chitinophaga caseinilytica TaxID=2267521 RepID=A0ABZ2YYA4_9BACT
MKRIFTALLLCGIIGGASAQDKKNIIQAGIGFGNTLDYASGAKGMPTLNFTYERILPYKVGPGYFGAGITASYRSVKYTDHFFDYEDVEASRKWKYSNSVIALRGAYHLNSELIKIEKLDLYGALQLGARFWSSKVSGGTGDYGDANFKSKDTDFHVGFIAGARYFFTPSFGVYSELGYDVTWIKLGVAGRF